MLSLNTSTAGLQCNYLVIAASSYLTLRKRQTCLLASSVVHLCDPSGSAEVKLVFQRHSSHLFRRQTPCTSVTYSVWMWSGLEMRGNLNCVFLRVWMQAAWTPSQEEQHCICAGARQRPAGCGSSPVHRVTLQWPGRRTRPLFRL